MRLKSYMYTFEIQQVIMSLSVPLAKESINALVSLHCTALEAPADCLHGE